LDADTARKISCGFGGGMRHGEVCGAVTGAIMILGLKYGQYNTDDKKSKEITYQYVKEFNKRFMDINGTIICRDLL
jgi:C_GCAxxG_C_C family probable redox protein